MTKRLIVSGHTDAGDHSADVVVVTGDYGLTPVKAVLMARGTSDLTAVLTAGKLELDWENLERRLAKHYRQTSKLGPYFLERDVAIVSGVRLIGMHKPDVDIINTSMGEAHDGPTVICHLRYAARGHRGHHADSESCKVDPLWNNEG